MAATKKRVPAVDTLQPNAIDLLEQDHHRIDDLFKSFDKIKNAGKKKTELVQSLCEELRAHAAVKHEIFYPALREAVKKDKNLLGSMDKAAVEHESTAQLLNQLEKMKSGDDLFEARVAVLEDFVRLNVDEERKDIFPRARKTSVDLHEIGGRIQQRKLEMRNGMSDAMLAALALATPM